VLLDANPLDDIANTRRIAAVICNGRYLPRAALAADGGARGAQRGRVKVSAPHL